MKFSLNMAVILNEMGNEYGETLEDLGIDWRKVKVRKIGIEETALGDYLVIDVDIGDE